MKNKLRLIFLLAIILICGCSKNNNNEKTNNNEISKNSCTLTADSEMGFNKDFYCPEMKNIKHNSISSFFITNDGELYEYSYKKYSTTNTNCKKVETDIIFDKIVRSTLISKDGELYAYRAYESKLEKITNEQIELGRSFYGIDQMEIKLYRLNSNIFYLNQLDINEPEIYGYLDNNNLYLITYDWNNNISTEQFLYSFKEDEIIENLTNGYIITNYGYYVYDVINKKDCQKYADIKCEYGIIQIEKKENCINDVIYIDQILLVNNNMVNKKSD